MKHVGKTKSSRKAAFFIKLCSSIYRFREKIIEETAAIKKQ